MSFCRKWELYFVVANMLCCHCIIKFTNHVQPFMYWGVLQNGTINFEWALTVSFHDEDGGWDGTGFECASKENVFRLNSDRMSVFQTLFLLTNSFECGVCAHIHCALSIWNEISRNYKLYRHINLANILNEMTQMISFGGSWKSVQLKAIIKSRTDLSNTYSTISFALTKLLKRKVL